MRSLERKLVFVAVLMLSSAIISAEEVSTTEESQKAEDGGVSAGIHPRQDANAGSGAAVAANFLKGAGERIASGATNLIKGVENFVVGVLGAIDNRQLANQIDEAFKNTASTSEDDATTPDSEEEETTTVPTTTRRRRVTTTTTTKRTTRRYRTRPPTTQRAPEYSDPETTARSVDDTPTKVKSPAAPAQQQPIYQQSPQLQPIYILPNYQPAYPTFQGLQQAVQPVISGVRTQEGAASLLGAQQPIYQQVAQPVQGAQPLYQTQQVNPAAGIPGQLVGNSAVNVAPVSNLAQQNQLQTSQINQVAVNQASPINAAPSNRAAPIQSSQINPAVPQSSPVLAPVPASIQVPQQNPVPVIVPQQISIPGSPLSLPQSVQVQQILQALNSITQEPVTVPPPPTKPPSKLAQYSINRRQATPRRPATTPPPKPSLLGTVRLPNEPDDPSKLFIAPNGVIRPDIPFTPVRLPPQSGRLPPPPPPPPPSPEEASSSQPGEEGGSTAEPDETATEEPEELENTDTDSDNSENARN